MKTRLTALLLVLTLLLCLSGCMRNSDAPATTAQTQPEVTVGNATEAETENTTGAAGGKTLVVYFSATGTTKGVAESIAKLTHADLYEIQPAQAYTDADLNWNDRSSRSTKEQNDPSARPAIASETLSLDGYATIFIGYPIWWGEEPRILDTFAESYDFDGITMIPFCTSGGSGIGRSGKNLEDYAGSGTWLEGRRFGASTSESELQSWIGSLAE